jgi:hypothetical protein
MLRTGFTLSQNLDLACKLWEFGDTAPCFCDTTFGCGSIARSLFSISGENPGTSDLSKVTRSRSPLNGMEG